MSLATAFLRSVARTSTHSKVPVSTAAAGAARRGFSSTLAAKAQQAQATTEEKTPHDYHTVEDLQGLHAAQILPTPGSEKDAKMRHFTGKFVLSFFRPRVRLTVLLPVNFGYGFSQSPKAAGEISNGTM